MQITKELNIDINLDGEYIYVSNNTWVHESMLSKDFDAMYGRDVYETFIEMLYEIDGVTVVDYDSTFIVTLKEMTPEQEQVTYEKIKALCEHFEDCSDIKTCSGPDVGPANFLLPDRV